MSRVVDLTLPFDPRNPIEVEAFHVVALPPRVTGGDGSPTGALAIIS